MRITRSAITIRSPSLQHEASGVHCPRDQSSVQRQSRPLCTAPIRRSHWLWPHVSEPRHRVSAEDLLTCSIRSAASSPTAAHKPRTLKLKRRMYCEESTVSPSTVKPLHGHQDGRPPIRHVPQELRSCMRPGLGRVGPPVRPAPAPAVGHGRLPNDGGGGPYPNGPIRLWEWPRR